MGELAFIQVNLLYSENMVDKIYEIPYHANCKLYFVFCINWSIFFWHISFVHVVDASLTADRSRLLFKKGYWNYFKKK
jgi:hypothetical protein